MTTVFDPVRGPLRNPVYNPITGKFVDPTLTFHQKFNLNSDSTMAQAQRTGPIFGFTRSSIEWGFNESGVLVTAAANDPFFAHDLDGTPFGISLWDAATNSSLHARDFTNGVWTATNITPVKDATGLDNVANSASTLTSTAANGTIFQSITLGSAARTFSIYVKRITGSGNIDISDNNGTNFTTLAGLSSSVWTRHDITRTQANPVIGVRIVTSGDAIEIDIAGIETNSFVTPPIITEGSAVTRALAACSTADISGFNESEGTLYASGVQPQVVNGQTQFIASDAGGATFQHRFQPTGSAGVPRYFVFNGSTQADIVGSAITADAVNQFAMAYALNDFILFQDGTEAGADTSGAPPTGVTKIVLGANAVGGTVLNGYIQEFKYFNVRKNNSFLESITS